jgi:short-subunit dehydrogenase
MADSRSIIIVGVGPFISHSLAYRLAALGWKIALLSRSQEKLNTLAEALKNKHPNTSILTEVIDAGDANAFLQAVIEVEKATWVR